LASNQMQLTPFRRKRWKWFWMVARKIHH
jgi:hypothetical protein